MADAPAGLRRLVALQHGLVTREQLSEHAVTRAALRWRLGRTWSAVAGAVVAVSTEALSPRQRLMAAQLVAGPQAVLTGEQVCLHYGLDSALGNRPVRALVPDTQRARRVGFVDVRRTRRLDERPVVEGKLRLARPVRAVMDAARWAATANEARGLVIEAVQRGHVTFEALQHELEAGSRRNRRFARQAIADARSGAWSVPESDALRLFATSSVLPHVFPNPMLTVGGRQLVSPDGWLDDIGMAIMVHSRKHHQRDADWEGTVEQDGELTAHGILVIGFTPRSIATQPLDVLQRTEQVYLSARRSGRRRPLVSMTPRGPGLPP